MQFYHKDLKICKAEWSNEDYNQDEVHHPQPHWHFEKENQNDEVPEDTTGDDFEEFLKREEPETGYVFDPSNVDDEPLEEKEIVDHDDGFDVGRMHFSICSPWHDFSKRNKMIKPYNDVILSWFKSCLESMIYEHKFRYTPH